MNLRGAAIGSGVDSGVSDRGDKCDGCSCKDDACQLFASLSLSTSSSKVLPRHANTNGATTYTHLHSLKFAFDLECLQMMNTMSDRHLTFISARATRVLAISNICLHLGICLARGVTIHHPFISSSVLPSRTTYTARTPQLLAACCLGSHWNHASHMNSQLIGLQILNPSLITARDARVRDLVAAEPRTLEMPMS